MDPQFFPPHLIKSAAFPIGLGAGRRRLGEVPIQEMAQWSPQIALAIARGVQLAPYHLNVRASFTDSTNTTNPASFEGGGQPIVNPSICDQIVYSVTAPNAFAGSVWKPVYDFFYQRQSGIQATLDVVGQPRYTVAGPGFTPIDTLLSSLAEGWPCGWVFGYTQNVSMQFQQTIPVPSTPVNIIVTFRLWQPIGTDDFQMMSAQNARDQLAAMGYSPPAALPTPQVQR